MGLEIDPLASLRSPFLVATDKTMILLLTIAHEVKSTLYQYTDQELEVVRCEKLLISISMVV